MKYVATYFVNKGTHFSWVKEYLSEAITDNAYSIDEAVRMFMQEKKFRLGDVKDLEIYPEEEA